MSATDRRPTGSRGRPESSGTTTTAFQVPDMDCPSCVSRLEDHLRGVTGVRAVTGSHMARRLTVEWEREADTDRVEKEVARLGYRVEPTPGDGRPAAPVGTWAGRQARIAYASATLFAAGLLLGALGMRPPVVALPFLELQLPDLFLVGSALVGGWNFFPKGVRAAWALALDMNVLMTVAIVGALAIGEFVEASAIAFLFALAELLERYSVDRARTSVERLMEMAPEIATVVRGGREVRVPVDELDVGEEVVVRPGERVPVDGRVAEGTSAMDQSPITGESVPVEKGPGAEVYAGAINREGWVRFVVSRPASESTLARIVRLVEEAEGRKTRTERFVDRFARWYTPAVAVAAVLVTLMPPLLWGEPFVVWLLRGLTLLVIACPCALVISTPVAVVSGLTAAARHGVLIKGGIHLETAGEIRTVALDKTGTVTFGHPEVVAVHPLDGVAPDEALALAAAVETRSEHPVARAIVDAAEGRGLARPWAVDDFVAVPGRGARARLEGTLHVVGRPDLVTSGGIEPPVSLTAGGRTVVGLAREDRLLAWIALVDRPREAAAEAIRGLRAAGVERVVLLTGDRRDTAEAVGRALGVDEIRAELLPEGKVAAVRALEAVHGPVMMVGDGVNDAPALAASTVGVAMGAAGSDVALDAADIALMSDRIERLPYLILLSRRARRVIRQNIAAALLVKGILVLGVPLGWVSLIAAVVVGDMGVSLAVTLNALRLGRVRG